MPEEVKWPTTVLRTVSPTQLMEKRSKRILKDKEVLNSCKPLVTLDYNSFHYKIVTK